jgi:hypothetical protein
MNKACPLSEEEFCGVLRQALRHPKEYAEVRAILAEGGFTFSEWMGLRGFFRRAPAAGKSVPSQHECLALAEEKPWFKPVGNGNVGP